MRKSVAKGKHIGQAVHQALSTALLDEWGLPSLLAIWKKLTAKSRTA